MTTSGARSTRWRPRMACRRRAWRSRSGLDATTFNPSKRRMPDGRARWPSTESVAKVLDATGASLEAFTALVSGARALASNGANRSATRRIPLIGFAQAGGDGFFDDGGYPVGGGWDEVSCRRSPIRTPMRWKSAANSMEPVFRDGDMVIVSPSAPIRRGDRVVVRTARRRGDGQAAGPPVGAPDRASSSLNPAHPGLQFRSDRGGLDASCYLGEPIIGRIFPRGNFL